MNKRKHKEKNNIRLDLMKLPDLSSFTETNLQRLKYYDYIWLDNYRNTDERDPRYDWHRSNLLGEIVEKLIFEKLLIWANDSPNVGEFVLKGPYVHENPVGKGFSYNHKRQIYYLSSGETIGEFDALFRHNGCQYFIEIKYTDNKQIIKKFKYELLRKYNLFRLIFPNTQIGCLVITSYRGNISVPGIQQSLVVRIPRYDIDPGILKESIEKTNLQPPTHPKFKTLSQLRYRHFDYRSTLLKLHETFDNVDKFVTLLGEVMNPYIGLIERLFLGSTTPEEFNSIRIANNQKPFETIKNIKELYLAYKVKESNKPERVIYLADESGKCSEVFDMLTLKTKQVTKRKRARKDIKYLSERLRKLNREEVRQFLVS